MTTTRFTARPATTAAALRPPQTARPPQPPQPPRPARPARPGRGGLNSLALLRGRAVSGMTILVLVVNVAGMAVSFSSGDPRFMLAKDGAISSAIGIAILISVPAGRPLMTAGLRPFIVRGDAAKDAAFGRLAVTSARFRTLERRFSVVWGIACLGECAGRVACAFTLPVATTVWLSTVLTL